MEKNPPTYCYKQLHIDVARNSSDDFDPLHDSNNPRSIGRDPKQRPTVLAFQLNCLIEYLTSRDDALPAVAESRFRNYDFVFSDDLRQDQVFSVSTNTIDPEAGGGGPPVRVEVAEHNNLMLIGSVWRSDTPHYLSETELPDFESIDTQPDLTYVPDTPFFMKRKFLSTANAKNFIASSLADQAFYFDEVHERIRFPDMVPVSYISNAIFEKSLADNEDLWRNPMVYHRHQISVDRGLGRSLRSNHKLLILIAGPQVSRAISQGGASPGKMYGYDCFGLTGAPKLQVLFRARVVLGPPNRGGAARRERRQDTPGGS